MITEPQRAAVRAFFSYFRQDLVHEFGTPDGAIAQYAKDEQDPVAIALLESGIAALLAEGADDRVLAETLTRDYVRQYIPWGDSARAWLAHAAERIKLESAAQRVVLAEVAVTWRADIYVDGSTHETEEADALAHVAARDAFADSLRDEYSIEGALHIGPATIEDNLESAIRHLCFEAAAELLADGAVVDYRYVSSNEHARLAVDGTTVALTGSHRYSVRPCFFARDALLLSLHACGMRWLATLETLGRTENVEQLRPVAESSRAALAAAGLL